MEKYLYFNNSSDDTDIMMFPAKSLKSMEVDSAAGTILYLNFQFQGGLKQVKLLISDNTGTEIITAINDEIRMGKSPRIVIADETEDEFVHSSIDNSTLANAITSLPTLI